MMKGERLLNAGEGKIRNRVVDARGKREGKGGVADDEPATGQQARRSRRSAEGTSKRERQTNS